MVKKSENPRYQLLPPLTRGQFAALKQNIKDQGQVLVPVEKDEHGHLLDGHHRMRAVEELRAEGHDIPEPPTLIRTGLSEQDKRRLALTANLARRNGLTQAQKRVLVTTVLTEDPSASDRAVADLCGVSHSTVGKIRSTGQFGQLITKRVGRDGKQRVLPKQTVLLRPGDNADKTFDAVRQLARGESKGPDVLTSVEVRRLVANAETKRANTQRRSKSGPLPKGRFKTVVIDPPWPMTRLVLDARPDEAEELDYPTMPLKEIRELPVRDVCDDDGTHVYLWTTHKMLPHALEILKAWDARYECALTWEKDGGMTPFSWQYRTELVLFAHYGAGMKLQRMGLPVTFKAPRKGHSVKPEEFYKMAEQASPAPRLELFARRARPGWTCWGNEAPKGGSAPAQLARKIANLARPVVVSPERGNIDAEMTTVLLNETWDRFHGDGGTDADWDAYAEQVMALQQAVVDYQEGTTTGEEARGAVEAARQVLLHQPPDRLLRVQGEKSLFPEVDVVYPRTRM